MEWRRNLVLDGDAAGVQLAGVVTKTCGARHARK
jgi:hypothetical protein